jgi:hypothetical protein
MSSRLVKFVMNNGIQRCINMRNVLAIQRDGIKVTIEYNLCGPDGMGFLIYGTGFHLGGSRCHKEDLTFKCVKDAEAMYERLTAELS